MNSRSVEMLFSTAWRSLDRIWCLIYLKIHRISARTIQVLSALNIKRDKRTLQWKERVSQFPKHDRTEHLLNDLSIHSTLIQNTCKFHLFFFLKGRFYLLDLHLSPYSQFSLILSFSLFFSIKILINCLLAVVSYAKWIQ